jgi:hypothetical protein
MKLWNEAANFKYIFDSNLNFRKIRRFIPPDDPLSIVILNKIIPELAKE